VRRGQATGQRTVVGVVGTGNMGSALVKGWLRAEDPACGGGSGPDAQGPGIDLLVWDKVEACVRSLPDSDRICAAVSLEDVATRAGVVLIVVKPKDAPEVLGAVAGRMGESQAVVSAMAGVPLASIRALLGPGPALFRIMPNLGVELGVGAVALVAEPGVSPADLQAVTRLLEPLGQVEQVSEDLMDVVTAVSGSGPAFIALAMEGLEDGAVAAGLSRQAARALVREAALATAAGGGQSGGEQSTAGGRSGGEQAGGGEWIGIGVLEEREVRAAFRQAVEAALERSQKLRGAGTKDGATKQ
jgi:pyrroline-5-carboxylate reductase